MMISLGMLIRYYCHQLVRGKNNFNGKLKNNTSFFKFAPCINSIKALIYYSN